LLTNYTKRTILKKKLHLLFIFLLLLLTPILKLIRWRVLFVINSGTEDTISDVLPEAISRLLTQSFFLKTHHIPIGFIVSRNGLSLVVSNSSTNDIIWSNKSVVSKQIQSIRTWKARRIALGGILPSAISKFNMQPLLANERISLQTHGTVYMLSKCIDGTIKRFPDLFLEKRPISIIGSGYTGQALARHLESRDIKVNLFDIVNKDIFPNSKNVNFLYSKFHEISSSGLIILLSTKGDDGVKSIEQHLLPNMVLLSDTYPKVSQTKVETLIRKGVLFFECHAKLENAFMFPTYSYTPYDLLGGCFIQSYVESFLETTIADYDAFVKNAEVIGLSGFISEKSTTKE